MEPTFEILNSLEAQPKLPAAIRIEFEEAIALALKFNAEVVRPMHLEVDRKGLADNDYLPHDFVAKATEWGFFTRWIPKIFGGQGMNMLSLYPFIEEISSVCAGLANVIGVHYLGVSVLSSSGNAKVINRILREVVRQEQAGKACIISLAWTEPDAGSDQFEAPLLDGAKVRTLATRVAGGYKLTGNKIFISDGHLATWHMVIAYEDPRSPADSLLMLAVKTGTPGFTLGRKEHKMGQKACVASELIFDECFVPEANVCYAAEQVAGLGVSPREAAHKIITLFPGVSKPGVGAIAAGIARGACDTAVAFASSKRVAGERLVDQQWAQMALADMHKNAVLARTLYMEAAYALALKSMLKMLFAKPVFYLSRLLPRWFFTVFVAPLFGVEIVNRAYRKMNFGLPHEDEQYLSGFGALSKFASSDLAVLNSSLALDLMGADGTRHELGAEKFLRDAKLLQIYEGTNEIGRVNMFLKLIAPRVPNVRVFDKEIGGRV